MSNYSDEDVLIIARYLPDLTTLWAPEIQVGWEGVTAISVNLTAIGTLGIGFNEEIRQGCPSIGRLPRLKILELSSRDTNVDDFGGTEWMTLRLLKQLRLKDFCNCKHWHKLVLNEQPMEYQLRIRQAMPEGAQVA